jgi:hypothetical protein
MSCEIYIRLYVVQKDVSIKNCEAKFCHIYDVK